MTDTWESVTAERKLFQKRQGQIEDDVNEAKKELRHKVDQIRDAFDRVDRAEREGMTILSEAIDGQSMKELERLSEANDQLFREGRYALDDFESDQIHEYDISLNQQLDTLDAQDDILRRKLGDL